MSEHEVVIVGGGPTGMMLAAELALARIDVGIVERRMTQDLDGSRAGGLHSRTIEILDQRGVAERFLSQGQGTHPFVGYAGTFLDISDFPTRHNYILALWQRDFERIMAEWVAELGVPVLRGQELAGFEQDSTGVSITLAGGERLRARYLVGCDGGRSFVRKAAGIDFPGWDATTSHLIAEAEMTETPVVGMRPEGGGIGPVNRDAEGGPYRVVLLEDSITTSEPSLQDLRDMLISRYGTDFGVHSPTWISRFTDMCRQAAAYRNGRILLAGDAAHIHGPQGGQGLNVGVQDAVNLGWKLAQVVRNTSPETLLDTYHTERHPVAARVLRNTMAQVALSRIDERSQALRETTLGFLAMPGPRIQTVGMISGLDIQYDLGEGHSLLGRRMPDLDIVTANGPSRVYEILRDARPLLLDFGSSTSDIGRTPNERVKSIAATCAGPWELPVIGPVPPPAAVLVRPDGYVAWVGEGTNDGLEDALTQWC